MKRSFLVLPIVVAVGFLLFTQCNNFFGSDSDDDSVGGGGADFDPTLYYSKAEIHSLLPRCTGSGGLSDQLPLSSHRGGYSNGYPFDDVPEHCAYAIVSVTADHTPPQRRLRKFS
jgi:hypothetical protein